MSTEDKYIEQLKAKIHDWSHEIIELEARVKGGHEDPEQLQIWKQRIEELNSEKQAAEKQIEGLQKS